MLQNKDVFVQLQATPQPGVGVRLMNADGAMKPLVDVKVAHIEPHDGYYGGFNTWLHDFLEFRWGKAC